jgi:hypothetical protein
MIPRLAILAAMGLALTGCKDKSIKVAHYVYKDFGLRQIEYADGSVGNLKFMISKSSSVSIAEGRVIVKAVMRYEN